MSRGKLPLIERFTQLVLEATPEERIRMHDALGIIAHPNFGTTPEPRKKAEPTKARKAKDAPITSEEVERLR